MAFSSSLAGNELFNWKRKEIRLGSIFTRELAHVW